MFSFFLNRKKIYHLSQGERNTGIQFHFFLSLIFFYYCYRFLYSLGVYFLHTIYCFFLSLGVIFSCFRGLEHFIFFSQIPYSKPCHSENSQVVIFCRSILQQTYSKSNFIQDCCSVIVQNMASLAIAMVDVMVLAVEGKWSRYSVRIDLKADLNFSGLKQVEKSILTPTLADFLPPDFS